MYRGLAALLLVFLVVGCASSGGVKPEAEDLVNPALSPGEAQWLVGPISWLASAEEIRGYLSLSSDEAADEFVRQFWRRRDESPGDFINETREVFDGRAAEADRRFSESGVSGRRTDRGAYWVLFGEPDSTEFEVGPVESQIGLEVWRYENPGALGLHGKRPERLVRFYKPGDLTVLYRVTLRSDPARRPRRLN